MTATRLNKDYGPRFKRTYTVTSPGFVMLDNNTGIDKNKVTQITGTVIYNTGQVSQLNYYNADYDFCFVYFENWGGLYCNTGTAHPSKPCTINVNIWYDD